MTSYRYTAVTETGERVRGVENAPDAAAARTALLERQLDPIELDVKKSIWQYEITKERVSRKELMHFSRQLAVFMRAGIPITDALRVIGEDMSNKRFKAVLQAILDSISGGSTLADAVSMHTGVFPSYYVGILRSAEATGNLDQVLDQLADYIERDLEARRRITSALVYPCVVVGLALVTVVVLTVYVLPRFKKFFESLNAKLPLATRILLSITDFVTNRWYVFVGLLAILGAVAVWMTRTDPGKATRDRLALRTPALGSLIRHAMLERFCRTLGSMVRTGVPLPEAMLVTTQSMSNAVFRDGLTHARAAMMRGEGLARPLSETGLFPASARQMLRVGENTGSLDQQLDTAATYFDRELDHEIKRFTSLFEPAVIIFVGVIVGFVAIALVSAMYGIYNQVGTKG